MNRLGPLWQHDRGWRVGSGHDQLDRRGASAGGEGGSGVTTTATDQRAVEVENLTKVFPGLPIIEAGSQLLLLGAWVLASFAIAGVPFLFRHGRGPEVLREEGTAEDVVRATAVFGGHEVVSRSSSFRGGSATAVFGGVTIDLRNARLHPEGAVLDVTAILGGAEILVPRGWRVTTSGTPILGGIENKAEGGEGPELRIDALTVLGGTDIKHERG